MYRWIADYAQHWDDPNAVRVAGPDKQKGKAKATDPVEEVSDDDEEKKSDNDGGSDDDGSGSRAAASTDEAAEVEATMEVDAEEAVKPSRQRQPSTKRIEQSVATEPAFKERAKRKNNLSLSLTTSNTVRKFDVKKYDPAEPKTWPDVQRFTVSI